MKRGAFPWQTAALIGGGLVVGLPLLRGANVPRYTSGPLKGKVNLAALYGQEYAEIAKRNGYWQVPTSQPLYSYNARLTPAEADSLIESWEKRIAVVAREQSDAWKRWEVSFREKYHTYGVELNGLVNAMMSNSIAASQAFAAGQTTDKRFLQTVRGCPAGAAYYNGWGGRVPILSCFLPKAALVDANGGSLAGGSTTMGKYFSFAYSSKIWHQLRTLTQALSTWEITAETAPQPRFSDELPAGLSHIARVGECLAEDDCVAKTLNKYIPGLPDFGGLMGTAVRWSVYLGLGYVGYKVLTAQKASK